MLGVGPAARSSAADLAVWPPAGATAVDVTGAYERLAARGYWYGPAFQGLRALWRRGQEVFAEVAVPDGVEVGAFEIHPALLDAVLHAGLLTETGQAGDLVLPFTWAGVSACMSPGATRVRASLAPAGEGAVSLELTDPTGSPVLSVQSLVVRPITAQQLATAVTAARGQTPQELLEVVWTRMTLEHSGVDDRDDPSVFTWDEWLTGAAQETNTADRDVVVWEWSSKDQPGSAGEGVVGSAQTALLIRC